MAKKRGNNEGTICKRPDGRWMAAVTVGRDENGKIKRSYFYGKTRQEVAEKLNKALNELKQGTFVEPAALTIGQWIETWLREYKYPPKLRVNTYASYEWLTNKYIRPAIAHIKLQDLRPHHLQALYNENSADAPNIL